MTQTQDAPTAADVITAEMVAKTVAGIVQIGAARRALEKAGWTASIVGNRITVADYEAQLINSNGQGWWQVYAMDGTPPVWTVGTKCQDHSSNWIGCVE